jgi:hypothetical protein
LSRKHGRCDWGYGTGKSFVLMSMFKPFKTESTATSIARAGAWIVVGFILGSVAVVITHVVVSVF